LGLALVKALASQHGGGVSIESRENFGTTVSIELPRASRTAPPHKSSGCPISDKDLSRLDNFGQQ